MINFQMPNLGADMEAGVLVEWRKKPGDHLHPGDIIADVDTQKGLIEIEVFDEGVLEKILVDEGEKVPVGTVLALINDGKDHEPAKPFAKSSEVSKPVPTEKVESAEKAEIRIKITPLARKMAESNQVDIRLLKGTGPGGSIVKADVVQAILDRVKVEPTLPEEVRESKEQPEEKSRPTQPVSDSIRLAVAAAMSRSNREIPHYFLEKRIDLTKSLAWLKEQNKNRPVQKRILPVALWIKAVAKALDEVPDLNAFWENGLTRKNEINIGFVVSLRSGGIVVPAILQADSRSVEEIMDLLQDIIPRARNFNLRSSELSQSTFTLTSIGEGGADKVFGLIYPPQVGIVGFGGISEQPFAKSGMLGICPVVDVTLAADHRATDGLIGSRFLAALDRFLQNPESL